MDLKCRTLLKKTAWPGEGMQLLKNMGFKTAAMALRDDSVGIDNQTLQAEEKLAIVLGTEGDGLSSQTIADRSEERRVGKECRSRWSPYH